MIRVAPRLPSMELQQMNLQYAILQPFPGTASAFAFDALQKLLQIDCLLGVL